MLRAVCISAMLVLASSEDQAPADEAVAPPGIAPKHTLGRSYWTPSPVDTKPEGVSNTTTSGQRFGDDDELAASTRVFWWDAQIDGSLQETQIRLAGSSVTTEAYSSAASIAEFAAVAPDGTMPHYKIAGASLDEDSWTLMLSLAGDEDNYIVALPLDGKPPRAVAEQHESGHSVAGLVAPYDERTVFFADGRAGVVRAAPLGGPDDLDPNMAAYTVASALPAASGLCTSGPTAQLLFFTTADGRQVGALARALMFDHGVPDPRKAETLPFTLYNVSAFGFEFDGLTGCAASDDGRTLYLSSERGILKLVVESNKHLGHDATVNPISADWLPGIAALNRSITEIRYSSVSQDELVFSACDTKGDTGGALYHYDISGGSRPSGEGPLALLATTPTGKCPAGLAMVSKTMMSTMTRNGEELDGDPFVELAAGGLGGGDARRTSSGGWVWVPGFAGAAGLLAMAVMAAWLRPAKTDRHAGYSEIHEI